MRTKYEVFRIICEKKVTKSHTGKKDAEEKVRAVGAAFLLKDNMLITCRHVVKNGKNEEEYSIHVFLNNEEDPIKCHIVGWDTEEDKFDESTIVVLKTEKTLVKKAARANGSSNAALLPMVMCGFANDASSADSMEIDSPLEIPNAIDGEKGIQCEETKEWVNRTINLKNGKIWSYEGLSGSPMYDIRGDIFGVFVAHKAYKDGPSVFGYGYCDNAFHDSKDKALEMAKRKEKEEAERKASQPIRTFAEYVAEACHDRPMGLSILADPSEYTQKYPGQNMQADESKLKEFLFQIHSAGREIDPDSARKNRANALEILDELYGNNPKYILDVYISGLYNVLLYAYKKRKELPQFLEAAIILLEVAAEGLPEDFPQRHLFLAECFVALGKDADAREAIKKAKELCEPEATKTNCYANIHILSTCCRTAEGEEMSNEDVLSALHIALKEPEEPLEGCECYLCAPGARRMMSYYYAHKPDFYCAVDEVQEAFNLDRSVASQDGCKEDYECFRHIYLKALDHHTQKGFESYEEWHKFRTYAAKLPLYNRIEEDNLKPQEDKAWRSVLKRWNCNGRNCNKEVLKTTDVLEYADSVGRIDTKDFEKLLQTSVHKALFVTVTDCAAENFEELSNGYDTKLSNISGMKGEGGYYPLDGGTRLYIYEYWSMEGKSLPVWHLICMK